MDIEALLRKAECEIVRIAPIRLRALVEPRYGDRKSVV